MSKSRAWCFTLNNYSDADLAEFDGLDVVYAIRGKEIAPGTSTPHLQGYLYFENPRCMPKKIFGGRAHWEKAKGTPAQASDYCKKEGDFKEIGELPTQGKRSDLEIFKDAVKSGERNLKRLREEHSTVFARHKGFCIDYMRDNAPKPVPPVITLRPWQTKLIEVIKAEAHAREIYFIVDPKGNGGKSTFCTYVQAVFEDVQIMKPGRYADMAYDLSETTRILLVDTPRSRAEVLQYHFLEDVKDGRVHNSKYESYTKVLGPCHVIVMLNEHPDKTKLSLDRYVEFELLPQF